MPLPIPSPLDVKLMNTLSGVLGLVFAAMVLTLGGEWLMRQPLFNLSAIHVGGDLMHNNVATLRANVTSKGGTTEQAIASFEASGLKSAILRGAKACRARSIELGEQLSQD